MKNLIKKSIYIIIFAIIINIATLSNAHAAISTSTLVDLVNSSRAENKLAPLTINSQLEAAAAAKAQDMFKDQYFAHNSPSGKTPWSFISAAGYNYIFAGENLSIGYTDNTELHNAWMNSPSHRENILNPNFREIGIASLPGKFDGADTVIVVQMFGSKESAQPVAVQSASSVGAIIDAANSGVTPTKIFVNDEIELKAALKTDANEVYFTIGDQKIDITDAKVKDSNNVYDKKMKFNKEGTLPITLTVVDKQGNRESKSFGKLTVEPKVLAGSAKDDNISNVFGKIGKNNLIIMSIVGASLVVGIAAYVIVRRQRRMAKLA